MGPVFFLRKFEHASLRNRHGNHRVYRDYLYFVELIYTHTQKKEKVNYSRNLLKHWWYAVMCQQMTKNSEQIIANTNLGVHEHYHIYRVFHSEIGTADCRR